MLFRKRKPTDKELEFMLQRSARLRKIEADKFSGWADFVMLLEDYVDARLEMKKNLNLNEASDDEIHRIKMYDREVWFIKNVVLKCASNFVAGLDARIKQLREEEKQAMEVEA